MMFCCVGGKGGSLFGGLGGSGGGSEHFTSYDAGHASSGGHDSYGGGSSYSAHGRSLLDEAEVKVNSMIEAATRFFEGDDEPTPVKTE